MLSPEVWNFEPPASSTRYEFADDMGRISKVISSQYFNHLVSLTIPDAMRIHPSLESILLEDNEFYHVKDLHTFTLVNSEFIDLFVKKGQLTLISVGTHLDEDDCLAVTPTGKLVLLLCRKTFQELGIEGKPSAYTNNTPHRYIITIDLTESSFTPGKKNYERVLERFKVRTGLCFSVVLAWEPHKPEICPSSIAAYLTKHGYKVRMCKATLNQRIEYGVHVPILNDESDGEVLTEWLGAFNLNCNIPEKANGYITTYERPENCQEFGQVLYFMVAGLFTITRIQKLVQEIRSYISNVSISAWLGLTVNGFEDSILNRGNQENFFFTNGDYHYTIFFRNEGLPLLCIHTSSTRKPKLSTKLKKKKNKKKQYKSITNSQMVV